MRDWPTFTRHELIQGGYERDKVLSMSRPEAPISLGHERTKSLQRWEKKIATAGIAVALLLMVTAGYIRYEADHDLPNPSWGILNGDYSYTFDNGPPGVSLVDIRPDELVSRYFHDYIRVAGTYPCDASLTSEGGCKRYRPVTAVHIGPTRVVAHHFLPFNSAYMLEAFVSYRIDYVDGQYAQSVFELGAYRSQPYFTTRIHATCWDFGEAVTFYRAVKLPITQGLVYYSGYEVTPRCAGYS